MGTGWCASFKMGCLESVMRANSLNAIEKYIFTELDRLRQFTQSNILCNKMYRDRHMTLRKRAKKKIKITHLKITNFKSMIYNFWGDREGTIVYRVRPPLSKWRHRFIMEFGDFQAEKTSYFFPTDLEVSDLIFSFKFIENYLYLLSTCKVLGYYRNLRGFIHFVFSWGGGGMKNFKCGQL